jgi:tRNA G18 (ribose-2'-O)-methylase SpoU
VAVERVTDARDPRLADYRDLREADHRRRGLFVVEGQLGVRRLLQQRRFTTRSVLATEGMLDGLGDLLGAPGGPRIMLASQQLIGQIVGFKFHRGCLAVGERGSATSAEALIAPAGARLVLVLDCVADPENVGAIFRNALAFGADAVLLSPGCGDPLARKALRASGGGALRVPFATVERWPEGLAPVGSAGYEVVALTPDGTVELTELGRSRAASGRLALLLGSEGGGLSSPARAFAALSVRIAMAPGVDSLNVATACGIALHHLARMSGPGRMGGAAGERG